MMNELPYRKLSEGNAFDVLPQSLRRESNDESFILVNGKKVSIVNPRFEAIDRTRHNLSLISNSNKLKSNSIILHENNNSIEYNLPREPETNKNRKSLKKPSQSVL
ncbi:MAG: hypothetical protein ACK521_09555 [bacterium]